MAKTPGVSKGTNTRSSRPSPANTRQEAKGTQNQSPARATTAQPLGTAQQTSTLVSPKYSFEEFKLYYESAEKVTDRRLANNNWNYSICVAIIISIAIAWNWSLTNSAYSFVVLSFTAILCIIAVLFTSLWIGQIRDFKNLNAAKFEVLNEMSHFVQFDTQNSELLLTSCCPFEKEWEKLQRRSVVQKTRFYNITALRSSNLEFFVPNAFRIVFFIILTASVFPAVWRYDLLIESWKKFLNL